MDILERDKVIKTITDFYRTSSGDSHIAYRNVLDAVYDLDYKTDDNRLDSVLEDYGFYNEETLRYVLDTFQKVVNEMSHGMLSKLTYEPDVYVKQFTEKFTDTYGHVETMVEDELPITYRNIVFTTNVGDVFSGYYDDTEKKFVASNLKRFDEFEIDEVYSWYYM